MRFLDAFFGRPRDIGPRPEPPDVTLRNGDSIIREIQVTEGVEKVVSERVVRAKADMTFISTPHLAGALAYFEHGRKGCPDNGSGCGHMADAGLVAAEYRRLVKADIES